MSMSSFSQWTFDASSSLDDSAPGYQAEDEQNEPETFAYGGKDCIIFLVDVRSSMAAAFTKQEDEDEDEPLGSQIPNARKDRTCFTTAIKAIHSALRTKIFTNESDLAAVVLYGSKDSAGIDGQGASDHVYALTPLSAITKDHVITVESLLLDDGEKVFGGFGDESEFNLSDALWTCSNMFAATAKTKVETRRVMIFTNSESPHSDDLALQVVTKARDMVDNGIDIDLINMSEFEMSRFWDRIVTVDDVYEAESETARSHISGGSVLTGATSASTVVRKIRPPAPGLKELIEQVRVKTYKKRARMTIPLRLGEGVELGVKVYNLIGETAYETKYTYIHQGQYDVTSKTRHFCDETTTPLMKEDLRYSYPYGGEQVIFHPQEKDSLRNFGVAGLQLLGFKPLALLPEWQHVHKSSFIYPDETVVKGSTRLFSALHKRLLAREKVAICCFVPRQGLAPAIVALVPQQEERNENKDQTAPPGMHVVYLPYADDLRDPEIPKPAAVSDAEIAPLEKLIKRMTFKGFSMDTFQNPGLQQHYMALESLALNRSDVPEVPNPLADPEIPPKAVQAAQEFAELVYPEGYEPEAAAKAKRASAAAPKVAKVPKVLDADEESAVLEHFKNGTLKKLTVDKLKSYIKSKGERATGKKADLIAKVESMLS